LAIEQLTLEGREEALAHGVVVRVAHAAHRRPHAGLANRRPKASDVYWQPWSE
jgi:hypothetical protein